MNVVYSFWIIDHTKVQIWWERGNLVDVKHKMKEDEQKVWNIKKCHYITTTKNSYGQNHEDKEKNHDSQEK